MPLAAMIVEKSDAVFFSRLVVEPVSCYSSGFEMFSLLFDSHQSGVNDIREHIKHACVCAKKSTPHSMFNVYGKQWNRFCPFHSNRIEQFFSLIEPMRHTSHANNRTAISLAMNKIVYGSCIFDHSTRPE